MSTQDQYFEVLCRIKAACERSGRDPKEVTLIAVSKTKPEEEILTVYEAGCRTFGENRVQEMCQKAADLPSDIRWHLIGHLQQNKVKHAVSTAVMIHSVDSVKLAQAISKEAVKKDRIIDILVEVNAAEEESKFGISAGDVESFLREISPLPGICVKGLMTVAPFVADPEENRAVFREMKQISVDVNQKKIDNIYLSELSMGMTNDFEVAVEEGATIVRVGTAIFGERNYVITGEK